MPVEMGSRHTNSLQLSKRHSPPPRPRSLHPITTSLPSNPFLRRSESKIHRLPLPRNPNPRRKKPRTSPRIPQKPFPPDHLLIWKRRPASKVPLTPRPARSTGTALVWAAWLMALAVRSSRLPSAASSTPLRSPRAWTALRSSSKSILPSSCEPY